MRKWIIGLMVIAGSLSAEAVYATFTVQAAQSASLAFSAGGVADKIYVDVGDAVHRDQVLAVLKSDDLVAAVRIAEGVVRHARQDYDRLRSVQEVTDQRRLDGAQFQYENAQAQLAYKQALLDKTVLKAPFDGTIVARNVEQGDAFTSVRPTVVFRLQSTHARKLILAFDQKYWNRVHAGQTFEYTVDGDTTVRRGTLAKVYPAVDAAHRKMQAEVRAHDIPSGLFGEGKILLTPTSEK